MVRDASAVKNCLLHELADSHRHPPPQGLPSSHAMPQVRVECERRHYCAACKVCTSPSHPHCTDWGSNCHCCHHHHVSFCGPNGGGDIQGLPKNVNTSILDQLHACTATHYARADQSSMCRCGGAADLVPRAEDCHWSTATLSLCPPAHLSLWTLLRSSVIREPVWELHPLVLQCKP